MNTVWESLIESGGGILRGPYVLKPGVLLISKTEITEQAQDLFKKLWLGTEAPAYEQSAEFAARLTYLQFSNSNTGVSSHEYNRKMVQEYGHYSVHASHVVTFLLAGISTEASLELVAHREASVARLTTNRTKAQDNPLFVIRGEADAQMTYFEQLPSRDDIPRDTLDDRETRNRLLPSKATALTFTMSLKDYHKTFIGRLSFHGVEEEVRDICERMCDILHEEYPLVIRDSSWYYNRNNVEKYDMG